MSGERSPLRVVRLLLGALVAAGLLAACSGSASAPPRTSSPGASRASLPPTTSGPPTRTRFAHVFVVVMENESYQAALADPSIAALARRYAYDTRSYGAAHPSLPNYLALTAGSTFGITSDCLSCFVASDNLGAQLSRHGVSWDAFFEDVSSPCYLGTSYGLYAAKHNPFRYFHDMRASRALCSHLLPYPRLRAVLERPAAEAPRFVWVTPNVCDDGHSCPESVAGRWLAGFVREVTASRAWRDRSLLLVTWDEGSFGDPSSVTPAGRLLATGGGGHLLTLVVSPLVRAHTVLRQQLSPYGLLATIEENFGLPLLGAAHAWSGHTLLGLAVGATGGSP